MHLDLNKYTYIHTNLSYGTSRYLTELTAFELKVCLGKKSGKNSDTRKHRVMY